MAIRNIRKIGDDVLRKKCKEITEITPRDLVLIKDMAETMYVSSSSSRNFKKIICN